jgi:AraC-like DNA-binding protein
MPFMDYLPFIEISEVNKYIVSSDNYQNLFTITDIDANISRNDHCVDGYSDPVRLNGLFISLVLSGKADISLDYIPYTLSENDFLIIMPSHIVQVAETSKDFKAKILIADRAFLEEVNPTKRSPAMSNYMVLRKNPRTKLEAEETRLVADALEALQNKIRLRSHAFHKEVLQIAFVGFMLEVANILVGKNDALVRPTLSRKEEILNNFLELLTEHVLEHHVVSFYAEKLFITSQYLSLVLKTLTGKSANKWIDDALVIEAKILLKTPQITVQQVADKLNFSDQSTFGKFFKKHAGVSPMEYRKS